MENKTTVSPWVKAFVCLHILAIVSWCLPVPGYMLMKGMAVPVGSDSILVANEKYVKPLPLRQYLLVTGFWQYWDMFAPDPASTNITRSNPGGHC